MPRLTAETGLGARHLRRVGRLLDRAPRAAGRARRRARGSPSAARRAVHANRSVPVALEHGARSVDHLACLHPDDVAWPRSECAAVLLPGAELLGDERVAPGRELADAGAVCRPRHRPESRHLADGVAAPGDRHGGAPLRLESVREALLAVPQRRWVIGARRTGRVARGGQARRPGAARRAGGARPVPARPQPRLAIVRAGEVVHMRDDAAPTSWLRARGAATRSRRCRTPTRTPSSAACAARASGTQASEVGRLLELARGRCSGSRTRSSPARSTRRRSASFTEMVQAGYGAVGEFHYVHRRPRWRRSTTTQPRWRSRWRRRPWPRGFRSSLHRRIGRAGWDGADREPQLHAQHSRPERGGVPGAS